ncbi:hypothetical protein ACLOJK_002712 [Asimina triloba]
MRSSVILRHLQTTPPITTAKTHAYVIKTGAIADTYTANNILASYARCGQLMCAHNLFEEIPLRDTISWNSMIAGCVRVCDYDAVWVLLRAMKLVGFGFDEYTFGSTLKAIACMNHVGYGRQIHSVIIKTGFEQNVFSGSALLDMYAKCDQIEEANAVFECMPERNSVSWNAMIAGYAQADNCLTAFFLLGHMERVGVEPDEATFASLLTLLDEPKFYKLTTQLHAKLVKQGLASDTIACNAIITAYSECGSIKDAVKAFDDMEDSRDLVSWNSMLAAYAFHYHGVDAVKLFITMHELGIDQDLYSYTTIISACFEQEQHRRGRSFHGLNGLSVEALEFFGEMRSACQEIDHYAFSAVLRSCSDLAVLQLGRQAIEIARHLVVLEPEEHSTYVLLSNMYAGFERWSERAMIKRVMRERGLRKVPGWSWIEVKNQVHSFNAEDRSHPLAEEIYEMLWELMKEIGISGYVANMDLDIDDLDC